MKIPEGCIIVSGGSKGLGLHLVTACLEVGAAVATFARSLTPEIETLRTKYGKRLLAKVCDARKSSDVKKFVDECTESFGTIAALINNAAVGQDHLLVHLKEETIDDIIAINLKAAILLTRAVMKKMLVAETPGRIINISSICGVRGYAGLTVYSATKGAMDAFTRSLAREVGSRGISVNSVAPGFFSSEMSAVLTDEQLTTIRRRTATETLTTPEDVAAAVKFLLFDATNITGQTIYVDGGAGI